MFFRKQKALDISKLFSELTTFIITVWRADEILSTVSLAEKNKLFNYMTPGRKINRSLVLEKLTLAAAVVVAELLKNVKDSETVNEFIGFMCSEIEDRGLLNFDDELVQILADQIQSYVAAIGPDAMTEASVIKIEKRFLENSFNGTLDYEDNQIREVIHKELVGFQRFIALGATKILSDK